MCHFRAQNGSFVLNELFLIKTINIPFIYQLALFIVQIRSDPELWGCTIFGSKMVHCPQKKFWENIINIMFICLLAPFTEQNFKEIPKADPEFGGCAIYGPKMAHMPKWDFFSENSLISLVPFIHAYLHAKNQILIF